MVLNDPMNELDIKLRTFSEGKLHLKKLNKSETPDIASKSTTGNGFMQDDQNYRNVSRSNNRKPDQ